MNILKRYLSIALIFAALPGAYAQFKHFPRQGIITFEKKVNMYALLKQELKRNPDNTFMSAFVEDYQKKQPQFRVMKSTLAFSKDQTLFSPMEESSSPQNNFFFNFPIAGQHNIIATQTEEGTSIAQKKVFEQLYLVKDSTRKINWKITDEMRNIAGYDCRRANALIMDSVYVVAFYTNLIPVAGGPESFTGLPGMILGVALPYEHVTWFATSVQETPVPPEKLKAPVKGKPLDHAGLLKTLKEAVKNWGESASASMKAFLL